MKKHTVITTFLYHNEPDVFRSCAFILLVFNNLSFFSPSVRHFERGVGPGNEVGV